MLQARSVESASVRDELEARTLGQHLDSRMHRLLHAIGQPDEIAPATRIAALLTSSWRNELVADGPRWPSDITDDHTPFELSLALGGPFEGASDGAGDATGASSPTLAVRLLTEPRDPHCPSLAASWALAAEIHEELAASWGASLSHFDKVADLFAPTAGTSAAFSVWHSAVLGQPRGPELKVYLNPRVHGDADAERVLDAALMRLGLLDAWLALRPVVLQRPGLDSPVYFSLDLREGQGARAKLYVAHQRANARDISRVLARFPGFEASEVESWLQRLMGPAPSYAARPPITCFAFDRGRSSLCSTTLHLPVRCYLPEDFEIARPVCGLLGARQQVAYLRALTVVADRPLQAGRGLQTYISLRASPGRQAVTVYLAPQVYTPFEAPRGWERDESREQSPAIL